MPRLALPDTELHYLDTGTAASGETLLMSHGLLMNVDLFAPQVAALRSRFRCIAYDHRGQGQSAESSLRSIDMGTLAGDAAHVVEKLCPEGVHFVGLSMGGFVGLRLAARRPELVKSLVLIATSAEAEDPRNVPKYLAMNLVARTLGARLLTRSVLEILFGKSFLRDPRSRDELERWKRHFQDLPRSIHRAVTGVIERDSVLPELARIHCPTLVLVGDEDVATPRARAERIVAHVEGAELRVVPRAGHSATVEEPEAVTREISAFLERQRPSA
ncbi:MAG: alpha/beta fold hydrolase [Polyangiaceae bacterium]